MRPICRLYMEIHVFIHTEYILLRLEFRRCSFSSQFKIKIKIAQLSSKQQRSSPRRARQDNLEVKTIMSGDSSEVQHVLLGLSIPDATCANIVAPGSGAESRACSPAVVGRYHTNPARLSSGGANPDTNIMEEDNRSIYTSKNPSLDACSIKESSEPDAGEDGSPIRVNGDLPHIGVAVPRSGCAERGRSDGQDYGGAPASAYFGEKFKMIQPNFAPQLALAQLRNAAVLGGRHVASCERPDEHLETADSGLWSNILRDSSNR